MVVYTYADSLSVKITSVLTHSQTLSKKDMNKLIEDIKNNGINETIKYVWHNSHKYIIDGHHRLIAAKRLGLKKYQLKK